MRAIRFGLGLIASGIGWLVLTSLLLIGIPVWLPALLAKRLAQAVEPPVIRWPEIYEFDPMLGWRAKANLDCHVLEDRDDVFHVVTDKFGWAGKATLAESELIVFGDSFAWGYGVDHQKTFFRVDPSLRIKTIGVPGYNLVQELLLMEQLAHQLKGKLVVWFIYIGNDLYDTLSPEMEGYRCPFVRQNPETKQWEIVTHHLSPERWTCSSNTKLRRSYAVLPALHSETFFARRAYAACEFLLERGSRTCREAGAELLIMSVPAPVTISESHMRAHCKARSFNNKSLDRRLPDRKLGEICARLGIHFEPLAKHLDIQHYKERDDHWTEEGHRCVAAVLRTMSQQYRKL